MRTNPGMMLAIGALLLCGSALVAEGQTGPNAIYVTGGAALSQGAAGSMAMPGPQTLAFLAGELRGNPVKGAPYSAQATTETTQTLADGNRIVNSTTAMVYRDAEGRERREQTLPSIGPYSAQGPPAQMIFISDPVAGASYSLNSLDHAAMKLAAPSHDVYFVNAGPVTALPGGRAMSQKLNAEAAALVSTGGALQVMSYRSDSSPAPNAPVIEHLGLQQIQGVLAEGTRTTLVIPAGQIGNSQPIQVVDEVWRSPDLQVIVQSTHSDPRMGTTLYTLNSISRTDPSPALFQVPAGYEIKESPAKGLQGGLKLAPPSPEQ